MRIQYRHPRLYEFLVHKLLYPKGLWEKFRSEVGKGNTIFDVGAGYGYASRFIHPANHYGIDLNEIFVRYGRKTGVNLEVKDIFDSQAYKKSDIFLVIDVVHHLSSEKVKTLFDLIFAHARQKVIVIDPGFISIARRYGAFGKFLGWVFRTIDDDGFSRVEFWLSGEEYQKLFQSRFSSEYGKSFEMNHQEVGGHQLVTFTKKEAADHRW